LNFFFLNNVLLFFWLLLLDLFLGDLCKVVSIAGPFVCQTIFPRLLLELSELLRGMEVPD
jgi:hypothetical protein